MHIEIEITTFWKTFEEYETLPRQQQTDERRCAGIWNKNVQFHASIFRENFNWKTFLASIVQRFMFFSGVKYMWKMNKRVCLWKHVIFMLSKIMEASENHCKCEIKKWLLRKYTAQYKLMRVHLKLRNAADVNRGQRSDICRLGKEGDFYAVFCLKITHFQYV